MSGDFHLSSGSPCLDAGDDSKIQPDWLDFDGRPRLLGGHVDMGAYESLVQPLSYTSPVGFAKHARWNLVSVPASPVNPDPVSVFAGIDVANASLQFWPNNPSDSASIGFQMWNPGTGWSGPIVRGVPYWFLESNATTDKTINYMGYPPAGDFILQLNDRQTKKDAPYWIMFGTPFPNDVPAANLSFTNQWVPITNGTWLEASSKNVVASKAFGFDAAAQQYFSVGPTETNPDRTVLQPWYGYWLLVDRPEALTITFKKP
jgi:hypothetical protein